ncbi:MAG: hypothetical protein ACYTG6_02835 [Planctomycetota bacterium]|jgi:hypothetical protein
MRESGSLFLALLLGFLLACFPQGVLADETEEETTEEESTESDSVEIRTATREEAAALVTALKRVVRKRNADDVLPVLAEAEGLCHPDIAKTLVKFLTHDSSEVALRALELLQMQTLLEEKVAKKLAKDIWKYGWTHQANKPRGLVRGGALVALSTVYPVPLNDRDFKEIEKLWRGAVGSPSKDLVPILTDVCIYIRNTKDKRLCRFLAEEIDEPVAGAVNAPTNPPASWWEARWHMWNGIKAEVVETLEVLTGQEFKDTESARTWFEENEREFGFKW